MNGRSESSTYYIKSYEVKSMANPATLRGALGASFEGEGERKVAMETSQKLPSDIGSESQNVKRKKAKWEQKPGLCLMACGAGFAFCHGVMGGRFAAIGQHFTDATKGLKHELEALKEYRS